MSGNEILVRRIVSEINAELSNIQRLRTIIMQLPYMDKIDLTWNFEVI